MNGKLGVLEIGSNVWMKQFDTYSNSKRAIPFLKLALTVLVPKDSQSSEREKKGGKRHNPSGMLSLPIADATQTTCIRRSTCESAEPTLT